MQWQEMLGHGCRTLLPRSSPTTRLLLPGSSSEQDKELQGVHMLHVEVPLTARPPRLRASPCSPASPRGCLMPATSSKPGRHQLQEVPRSVHWSPAGSALFSLAPSRIGTWALRMSFSLPSASQTITQDQRPISVELSFLPPLCIPCTYYCPIKTVLILTSLVRPLGCCDLIVFLAMSAGAPGTNPSSWTVKKCRGRARARALPPCLGPRSL